MMSVASPVSDSPCYEFDSAVGGSLSMPIYLDSIGRQRTPMQT